jgi:hypothetical protein
MRNVLALSLASMALLLPATAGAVIPPKDCGRITVDEKRYQVKADQISCTTGRVNARRFLTTGARPAGYTCRNYPSRKDRVDFYCNNGRKIFFAIRR